MTQPVLILGPSTVLIGHDNRESSLSLVEAAKNGVLGIGGKVDLRGLLTTPQLHWIVREYNQGRASTEENYVEILSKAYSDLIPKKETQAKVYLDSMRANSE